ncbi:MAG: hypothetical protein N2258_03370 [Brevinematales bacterium]|nr:hypothetical protein [Brevinematales bacterium]
MKNLNFLAIVMFITIAGCQIASESSGGSSQTLTDKDRLKGHWELAYVEPDATNIAYIQLSNKFLTNIPPNTTMELTIQSASLFMHVYFDDTSLTNLQISSISAILISISNNETNTTPISGEETNKANELYFLDDVAKKLTVVSTNLTQTNMILYYNFVTSSRVIMRLDTNFDFGGISNMVFDKK